jgi:hypothetical protein
MALPYKGQLALKIDYSLPKREVYIETIRVLMERRKISVSGLLDIICSSFPHESDGSLPLWVPDWTPTKQRV